MQDNLKKTLNYTTIKLTAWYLAIIMTMSIIFSFAIFQISSSEMEMRLSDYSNNLLSYIRVENYDLSNSLSERIEAYKRQLILVLIYLNIAILGAGGLTSFWFAKRILKPIEEAHISQGRFISDASHELRTPLASMQAEIEVILRDKNATKANLIETLDSNLEEVKKLTNLSSLLLNLSKLSTNGSLKQEKTDIAEIINQAISSQKKLSDRIEVSYPKEDIKAITNKDALIQIISIITDNALKYSKPNSKIKLSLAKTKNIPFNISISNQGIGIKEDQIPYIFNRFYQASNSRTTSTKGKGYGLGLSIAKELADKLNLEILVTSKINQTTIFSIISHNKS